MEVRRAMVACEVFSSELRCVIPAHSDVHLVFLPAALHTDILGLERELDLALSACGRNRFEEVFVLYGGKCTPFLDAIVENHGALRPQADNCLNLMIGPPKLEAEAEGAIVLTPGWIRAWPSIMKALGWDTVDVRTNLGRYSSAVVYDAGVEPLTDEEALWFFDLTNLFVDVRPLDLGYFRESVRGLLGG